jgi:hypothetical protein
MGSASSSFLRLDFSGIDGRLQLRISGKLQGALGFCSLLGGGMVGCDRLCFVLASGAKQKPSAEGLNQLDKINIRRM